jgi:hypothetical protein
VVAAPSVIVVSCRIVSDKARILQACRIISIVAQPLTSTPIRIQAKIEMHWKRKVSAFYCKELRDRVGAVAVIIADAQPRSLCGQTRT